MRVVLFILDALPTHWVQPDVTPNIWGHVRSGGRAPAGGLSLPISVTYSNHAAFATGVGPEVTGLWGNKAFIDGAWMPTYDAGPRAVTLFEKVAAAGKRGVMLSGDHKLVDTMGGEHAEVSWPPRDLPDGLSLDPFGYPRNQPVVDMAATTDLDADFLILQLNEPDTYSHLHGPDSDQAVASYRRTDQAWAEMVTMLGPLDDTVVLTVSDHCQETLDPVDAIDLVAALDGSGLEVAHDGTGAIVLVPDGVEFDPDAVRAVPGVESLCLMGPDAWAVWSEPRRFFTTGIEVGDLMRGQHGSPRTRPQVAVVGGGHPTVPALARRLETEQPGSLTWAPLISELLHLGR